MKNLLKLFIIVTFTFINLSVFSQTDLSNNPIKNGIVLDIRPEILIIQDDDGGVIITPIERPGAFVSFEIGDRVSYILILNYQNNTFLIKEIRLIGK